MLAVHDLASVLTLRLFVTGQGLQCLGRHLREMKVTVDPGSKSTFNMVRDRTDDMVSHTMMLNGVSLFLLGILALIFSELPLDPRLVSWLAPRLASNTGNASSAVGFPVGTLLVTSDLGKGNAFPAVKVSGLFLKINPLLFLVLLIKRFTAGATRQMSRGSRCNASPHDARKLSSSSPSSELDS